VPSTFERCLTRIEASPELWLVTGAAGFIGSHLVETLLRHGQRVVGLDDFSTGTRDNLRAVRDALPAGRYDDFRLIEGDICDFDTCLAATAGVHRVLHQAALGSVPRSIEKPLDTHRTNVDGTMNVFMAALESRVHRLVYASSSSVYGDEPTLPKVEERIGRPLSPYAASKRIGEIYAEVLGSTNSLCAVGLRYFNVVGPRQDPEGPYAAVVPRWLAALARGETPEIYGDGETSRDFCPVQNVVQANILAATSEGDLRGRVYNVALGSQTTLNELFVFLRDAMHERGIGCAEVQPLYRDFRPGDIRHSLADVTAARRDLGYEPTVDVRAGLAAAVQAVTTSARPG